MSAPRAGRSAAYPPPGGGRALVWLFYDINAIYSMTGTAVAMQAQYGNGTGVPIITDSDRVEIRRGRGRTAVGAQGICHDQNAQVVLPDYQK